MVILSVKLVSFVNDASFSEKHFAAVNLATKRGVYQFFGAGSQFAKMEFTISWISSALVNVIM